MKTIGYVLGAFPVLSETFVGTEMRAMAARGHRVVPIVLSRYNGPGQELDADLAQRAIHLDTVPPREAMAVLAGSVGHARRWLAYMRRQNAMPSRSLVWNAAKVAAVARRYGCDHLHAHFAWAAAAHAIVAARMIGRTVSFVGHGTDVNATPTDLEPKLEAVDFAVTVACDMVGKLRALAPRARVELVYTGIDPDRFRPAGDIDGNNGRMLFVGRLIPCKGAETLVRALALLPPAERPGVDIVGTGPDEASLRTLSETLGLNDHLHFLGGRQAAWIIENGPRYAALVGPFRQAADGSRDTSPVVIKEAMAMGLPIISTTLPGVLDLVAPGTGLTVPPDDPVELAAAIRTITHMMPEDRANMGRAGRRLVLERFTAGIQAARLSELVEAA